MAMSFEKPPLALPLGTKVSIKESFLVDFLPEIARKMDRGRVGEVSGAGHAVDTVFIRFPAAGRRKEYRSPPVRVSWLDVVEPAPASSQASAPKM